MGKTRTKLATTIYSHKKHNLSFEKVRKSRARRFYLLAVQCSATQNNCGRPLTKFPCFSCACPDLHSLTTMNTNSENSNNKDTPKVEDTKASVFTAIISFLVYGYFFGTFMSWFGFLLPHNYLPDAFANMLPYSMDKAQVSPKTVQAILVDFFLLSAFAIPHSILARASVKKAMGLPQALERSFFVLQAAIFMHIYMYCWQDFEPDFALWKVPSQSSASYLINGLFLFGMVFVLSASFALDHFHLFGLTQGFGFDFNKKLGLTADQQAGELVIRWHYSFVAHPIMTGVLITLWATPAMTGPRLLLAIVKTLYILVAVIKFEEPSLEQMIGSKYRDYRLSVPRFIPGTKLPTAEVTAMIRPTRTMSLSLMRDRVISMSRSMLAFQCLVNLFLDGNPSSFCFFIPQDWAFR